MHENQLYFEIGGVDPSSIVRLFGRMFTFLFFVFQVHFFMFRV